MDKLEKLATSNVEMVGEASASEREGLNNVIESTTGKRLDKENEGLFSGAVKKGLALGMAAMVAFGALTAMSGPDKVSVSEAERTHEIVTLEKYAQ